LGVAGFAALFNGLAPKRFPPIPVDAGAAGVLPLVAGVPVPPVAVAPPNKPPPVVPLVLVLVPLGPEPKIPPLGLGAGNPKGDPDPI